VTKEERTLVDEIKAEIDSLIRQYAIMVDTRAEIIKDLKQALAENEQLKKILAGNGRCYFLQGGPILPFKWRG
jgi:proline dehydrogenase